MLPRLRLNIGLHLQHAIFDLGQQAASIGTPDGAVAKAACDQLAGQFGDTVIPFSINARDFFAQACDHFRRQGTADPSAIANLEELIATLKSGKHAKIVGTLNYIVRDVGEAERAAEKMVKHVERIQKG